jgi:hypothetical protein
MAPRSQARNYVAEDVALTWTKLDVMNHSAELGAMIYGVELDTMIDKRRALILTLSYKFI